MRASANLGLMFADCGGLLSRYEAASKAGFKCVEAFNVYEESADAVADILTKNNLQQVLINAPLGTIEFGSRGLAAIPKAKEPFRQSIPIAIDYAIKLKCPTIHVMAGIAPKDTLLTEIETQYMENIAYAADNFATHGITCLIEPICSQAIPGYFLNSYEQATRYIDRLKRPNVKLLLDIYHAQHIQGNLTQLIKDNIKHIGHVQVAQCPSRNEPSSPGEIDFTYIGRRLLDEGYDGFVGGEYSPSIPPTLATLAWIDKMGLTF